MWSFIISILALVLGYILYGRFVERLFVPDPERVTPAFSKADGVDFIPLPTWKVFMIQFLNIAGTGPIFGAIMGAKFGPSCYLWIVFGCIFAGAVHDYFSGMLSMRHGGENLPAVISRYLGNKTKVFLSVFMVFFMGIVGTVYVYSPAIILGDMTHIFESPVSTMVFWIAAIYLYYVIATFLPIDKIIGKIYPLFAFALLFMAVALMVCLFVKWPSIPEFWDGLHNRIRGLGVEDQPIFPCLFITVACGAISGFHATQSPIMARCLRNEKLGRPVFYGSMITEGIVALVWAAVSSYFFFDGGMAEVGATGAQAPTVVTSVAQSWLGVAGGILAVLGVVAAPITSGDTAFRSGRLMLADLVGLDQAPRKNRIILSIPLFVMSGLLLWFNIADEDGFNVIWRYFGCSNQSLASLVLWTFTVYLVKTGKGYTYLLTMIPAILMTCVCVTYICTQKIGFNMPDSWSPFIVVITLALQLLLALRITRKNRS